MSIQPKAEKSVPDTSKTYNLTTDLFKSRSNLPKFILDHKVFKTPTKVSKVFPSIGLKNFREQCELIKPLVDNKKDNFISTLIVVMNNGLSEARDAAAIVADEVQYIYKGDDRIAKLEKVDEIYNLVTIARNLAPQLDNYNNNYEKIIQNSEGKITLKLAEDVLDANGKAAFNKNQSLFKVFTRLKEQFESHGINFIDINQTPEFKTFCVENVPNKKYEVVFSSAGSDGAWDILTMSMRGIKSCQRWDGDYPRCLIGSVLSKYVGIIYITSGADYEKMGDKMMRRALVRYAVDADENKPCILIDRLYPQQAGADVDEETLKVFTKALSSKTTLPVHFAPALGNKARCFYIPFEKIRGEVPERDWTYQDTALRTNLDFQLEALINHSNEDINRYITGFKARLVTSIGEQFRKSLYDNSTIKLNSAEITPAIHNMRIGGTTDVFNDKVVKIIFDKFQHTFSNMSDPKDSYRKYLTRLLASLKTIKVQNEPALQTIVMQSVSRDVNYKIFFNYVFDEIIKRIVIEEIKSLFS